MTTERFHTVREQTIIQRTIAAALIAVALPCGAQERGASAAGYPSKPIRFVLPYPPGGGTNTIARPLAQHLSESIGQQVIVDNRGGGSGAIGMEYVAKAPPDGYTMVMALTAQLAVNPSLFRKLPYDPVKEFSPITLFAQGPYVLVVHPALPVTTVKELVALARKRPNELTYASSGNGSGGHLAAEMLDSMTHIRMLHIPYKGGGPALIDLISGQVQVLFTTWASGRGHIQSGRMRALAVSTAKRPAAIPNIPTVGESGVPGYDAGVWYALLAPAATPRDIVDRLYRETTAVLKRPDYAKMLFDSAIDPIGSTPEQLGGYIRSETAKWAKVVKDANVHLD